MARGDLDEVEGVDDAVVTAGADAVDGLCVLEVGVHAGGGCDEPGAEVVCGVCSVPFLAGDLPGGDEGRYLEAQADEGEAVVVEVTRVRLAVAIDVGAVGVGGVGPEVVGFGEVVVRAARAAVGMVGGDADGLLSHIFVRARRMR